MNTQQQVVEREPGAVATVYVKSDHPSDSQATTINLINAQTGIIAAEPSPDQRPLITVRFNPQQTRGSYIVRALREAGYRRTCITLLYFKGDDPDQKQRALQIVAEQPGVVAAERSSHKGYVLMVHFDPRQTRASRLVSVLREQGYSAMIAGC